MTTNKNRKYEARLRAYLELRQKSADNLEKAARSPIGDDDLSQAPMHLGDRGTQEFVQEVNTALLEHETEVQAEVLAALQRIEDGTYGRCENCGRKIPAGRLDAVPYTRYCVRCAEQVGSEHPVNFNEGRPQAMPAGRPDRRDTPPTRSTDESALRADAIPSVDLESRRPEATDVHAAGTPGGGAAVGGLAGTTVGDGAPTGTGLEQAMGGADADIKLADGDPEIYGGPTGGAVGGTPANKRAVGGRARKGIAPKPDPGDSPTGP